MIHSQDFVRLFWDKNPILQKGEKLDMKEFNIVKYNTEITTKNFGRNGKQMIYLFQNTVLLGSSTENL